VTPNVSGQLQTPKITLRSNLIRTRSNNGMKDNGEKDESSRHMDELVHIEEFLELLIPDSAHSMKPQERGGQEAEGGEEALEDSISRVPGRSSKVD
jgi:hypothetical protein